MEPKPGGLEDDFPFQKQVILMVFDFFGDQILIFLSGPSIKFTGLFAEAARFVDGKFLNFLGPFMLDYPGITHGLLTGFDGTRISH